MDAESTPEPKVAEPQGTEPKAPEPKVVEPPKDRPMREYEQDTTKGAGVLRIRARGRAVLAHPMTNRGTAFTDEQRHELGLVGLLPTGVNTLDNQTKRVYEQFRRTTTPLGKYLGLASLRDRNEVLFYNLLSGHLEEMLPIIYTPTIGEAIEKFSTEYNRPRGVFLSIDRPEDVEAAIANYGIDGEEVDLVVITDSEGILGIGDQGVGGIQIAIGKLSVYTAAAGIHPRRVMPIVLDTGTDNLGLLSNELYLGEKHSRVRGERYHEFVDHVITTISRLLPHAMVHWEDFGTRNAYKLLNRYRDQICTFNDDIQGTAAVVLAAILAGVEVTGMPLHEHRIVVFGAGTAGIGISGLIRDTMLRQHTLTEADAYDRFWPIGVQGLYIEGQPELLDFQKPWARTRDDVAGWAVADPEKISLLDVVRHVKPTILIGTSTRGGAFTREVVEEMHRSCPRPIIFPLSNPTSRAEATPGDLLEWTDGAALVATGSPFGPVDHGGVRHIIAQSNNALIFPGLGLGVAVSRARRITETMILAASEALAGLVNAWRPGAALLPAMSDLRLVSATVAIAVAKQAAAEGLAEHVLDDPVQEVYERMWQPSYPEIEAI